MMLYIDAIYIGELRSLESTHIFGSLWITSIVDNELCHQISVPMVAGQLETIPIIDNLHCMHHHSMH